MPLAVNPASPRSSRSRTAARPRSGPGGPVAGPARVRVRAAAVIALTAVVLAGCAAPKVQSKPKGEGTASGTATAPAELTTLDAFYEQEITWEACDSYECATVQVPLDWDAPEAGAIGLALKRSLATGASEDRLGSLLINPGGPGASGTEFVDYAVSGVMGDPVLDAYDVVGFDPRGVGGSTAVDCGTDAVLDEFFTADVPMASQADVDAARERTRVFGESCLEATGPLLGEVDTVSAARDLDVLRAVLGDEKLSYAGFSYGTFLGATYAGLYPENVGRLLLDGALDPSMSNDDLVIGQAIGFEEALSAYVEDCQAGASCPLRGSVEEGKQQILDLVTRVEAKPIDAGGGEALNGALAFYGIVVTLYDDASWPSLTMALDEAIRDNTGAILLELAGYYLDRTGDGAYLSNSMEAFTAINCLDYPVVERSYDEMLAFADEVAVSAPTFGREFVMAVGCEAWPFQSQVERAPITAEGAAPILVVGTTGDPATPYEWSVALADQLESGHLLTFEGEGHTAYGRGGPCIGDAVDAYLVEGTLPEEGLVC